MIFVTVGAQMPFDRLVRSVDAWAGARGRHDVFAQIGPSDYVGRHLETTQSMEPAAFRARVEAASALVAHAGMGTILTALQLGKPLLVYPRLVALRETRNDHQVATARHFSESGRVLAAFDEAELWLRLDEIEAFRPGERIGPRASDALLSRIRAFVDA